MISSKSWPTPTLVDPPAVASIETGHDTLAELTVGAVMSGPAVTSVPLDTFPSVLTGPGADPALTPRALEARGTLTEPRGGAVASVHALRLTDRLGAKTTCPARPADTAAGSITVSLVMTETVTPGVLAHLDTLLPAAVKHSETLKLSPPTQHLPPQSQLQRGPGEFTFPGEYFQADAERRSSCEIARARKADGEGWKKENQD